MAKKIISVLLHGYLLKVGTVFTVFSGAWSDKGNVRFMEIVGFKDADSCYIVTTDNNGEQDFVYGGPKYRKTAAVGLHGIVMFLQSGDFCIDVQVPCAKVWKPRSKKSNAAEQSAAVGNPCAGKAPSSTLSKVLRRII